MSFRNFDLSRDVASIVSPINEVVAMSSSLFKSNLNVKMYDNIASGSVEKLGGYFQTLYDGAPSSVVTTPIFDVTFGYADDSIYNVAATTTSSQTEKVKMYHQMASVLLGSQDSLFNIGGADVSECFFLNVKRGIQKDELKKGSVSIVMNNAGNNSTGQTTASDAGATVAFKQAVGGDYGSLLYNGTGSEIGQSWYNAGVIVLPADMCWPADQAWSGSKTLVEMQYSGSIDNLCDGWRNHVERIDLHNQTNLYSSVYFCRATNAEFNYSSNPTFVDDDKRIRVTSGSNILQTRTYITTVGLYDVNDNLLAVAKVNKPITKSPDSEATFRVRIDF